MPVLEVALRAAGLIFPSRRPYWGNLASLEGKKVAGGVVEMLGASPRPYRGRRGASLVFRPRNVCIITVMPTPRIGKPSW